jgi:hypothetical protein
LLRFAWERPACLLACRLLDLPAFRHQSKESALETERGLHCKVRQIMQREERRMTDLLLLPSRRAIGPDAAQHTSAVRTFGELNQKQRSYWAAFASGTAINLRSSSAVLSWTSRRLPSKPPLPIKPIAASSGERPFLSLMSSFAP